MTLQLGRYWLRSTAFVLGLLVSHAGYTAAQTTPATISGRVLDQSGSNIVAATVSISEFGRTATTDSSGRFRFADVPRGTLTISARRIGYAPIATRVTVAGTSETTLDLVLSRAFSTSNP